jgi:hypothetical protein
VTTSDSSPVKSRDQGIRGGFPPMVVTDSQRLLSSTQIPSAVVTAQVW